MPLLLAAMVFILVCSIVQKMMHVMQAHVQGSVVMSQADRGLAAGLKELGALQLGNSSFNARQVLLAQLGCLRAGPFSEAAMRMRLANLQVRSSWPGIAMSIHSMQAL